jgi:superfamily II DNA helicase RecQ
LNKSNLIILLKLESGRAGRDGKRAVCKLLWSESDLNIWRSTVKNSLLEKGKNKHKNSSINETLHETVFQRQLKDLDEVERYCKTTECRRQFLLRYFGQDYDASACKRNTSTICDNCMAKSYIID